MNTPDDKTNSDTAFPADELFWRDEILQVMYWYCGEGLGKSISLRELTTFLPAGEQRLRQVLAHMQADGYVVTAGGSEAEGLHYAFTPFGSLEGARRFADEFAGLTDQAHGECNDPQCDCQTLGPAACSTRVTGAHSH